MDDRKEYQEYQRKFDEYRKNTKEIREQKTAELQKKMIEFGLPLKKEMENLIVNFNIEVHKILKKAEDNAVPIHVELDFTPDVEVGLYFPKSFFDQKLDKADLWQACSLIKKVDQDLPKRSDREDYIDRVEVYFKDSDRTGIWLSSQDC